MYWCVLINTQLLSVTTRFDGPGGRRHDAAHFLYVKHEEVPSSAHLQEVGAHFPVLKDIMKFGHGWCCKRPQQTGIAGMSEMAQHCPTRMSEWIQS